MRGEERRGGGGEGGGRGEVVTRVYSVDGGGWRGEVYGFKIF